LNLPVVFNVKPMRSGITTGKVQIGEASNPLKWWRWLRLKRSAEHSGSLSVLASGSMTRRIEGVCDEEMELDARTAWPA